MKKFELVFLKKGYYNFLKNNNLQELKFKSNRPYIGFIRINNIDYLIPLTTTTDKYIKNDFKYTKVLRDWNNQPLGTLLIGKMIPVINNSHFIKRQQKC